MPAYYAFSEHGSGVALAVAWVAFPVTVLLVHLRRVLRGSSTLVAKVRKRPSVVELRRRWVRLHGGGDPDGG